jgi:hypothetical protein
MPACAGMTEGRRAHDEAPLALQLISPEPWLIEQIEHFVMTITGWMIALLVFKPLRSPQRQMSATAGRTDVLSGGRSNEGSLKPNQQGDCKCSPPQRLPA